MATCSLRSPLASAKLPLGYNRTAAGNITEAYKAPSTPYRGAAFNPKSVAAKRGLKFEQKASKALCELQLNIEVEKQPHFRFVLNGVPQSIYPDALVTCRIHDILTIVEIKYNHTYDGWNQLTNLYAPVLSRVYAPRPIRRLEIVKQFNPGVRLPEQVKQVLDLNEWLESDNLDYGVHILR